MKTRYYLSQFFGRQFNELVRRKQDFEYNKTAYSKALKTHSYKMIFNPDGVGDTRILSLVNRVRDDAKKFLYNNPGYIKDTKIYFTDLFEIPKEEEIICKVDLTSAYWRNAMLDGVITEETNKFLLEQFHDKTSSELKKIRLKALGSLATKKEIEIFEKGVSVHWDIDEQPTKKLYLQICRCIDDLMRDCKANIPGCVFYYWDCVFVKKQFEKDAIKFFTEKKFECKSEETKLTFDMIGTKSYFTSEVDNKMYMVESQNKDLLKNIH